MKFFAYIFIVIALLLPASALAQDSNANQSLLDQGSLEVEGLGINPFLIEINGVTGSTINKTIKLTNTTNEPLSFVASINDFVPNGKTGQALFLDSDKESDPQFSLSRWITITRQPDFTIAPHGNTNVDFTIAPPIDAEPGTHYGGILFGRPATTPKESATAVQQKVGVIILVKLGKSQEEVSLTNFATSKKVYQREPVNFTTSLSNDGNVHSKPKGDITIKNTFGKPILQVPVNRDAQFLLPKTQRDFISTWMPRFAIGRYTAEEVLYYGSPKLEIRSTVVFWVLPVKEIILGVLIVLILGIIMYMAVKRYNRYIINNSK